jgi:hypothetical protein
MGRVMDNILAIDPGGTTGAAMYSYHSKLWHTWQILYKPIELYEFFTNWIADLPVMVICESFDYRPVGKYNFGGSRAIPKVDLTPRNVIGILELACAQHDVEIVWQKPSIVNGDDGRKTDNPSVFWTDAKVKQLGLYKRGHVHEMDAVKHILHYRSFTLDEQELFSELRPTKITMFEEKMR